MERIDIYSIISDLYDVAYAPKETMLDLVVTSNNITAKLLGASDQGGYNPISNVTIHIYELQDGTTWNLIGDYTTDNNGVVSINRTNTQQWYKAVFDGNDTYQPATAYAELQQSNQTQPPQPSTQQSLTLCPSCLWLLLLFVASLFERKEEQTEA